MKEKTTDEQFKEKGTCCKKCGFNGGSDFNCPCPAPQSEKEELEVHPVIETAYSVTDKELIEELKRLLDFSEEDSENEVIKLFRNSIQSAIAKREEEIRQYVKDWVEMMWNFDEFDHNEWTGEDEVEASLISYLEGKHLISKIKNGNEIRRIKRA